MAPVKRSKSSIDREQPLESSEREASFRHQRGASRPVASEAIAADLEEQMAALPDGLAGILTKFMDLLNELGSSRVYLERLEARLTKKLEAKQAVLLIPRRNFNDWQESILTDALLIGASTILEEKQSDPPSGCDKGRWLVLNNVLYDRITSSLSPQLAAEFRNHTGISAYGLYEEIIRRYQPSKAQLRLELLRKLFNMRVTNATYFESVEQYRYIRRRLLELYNNDVNEVLSDAFLITFSGCQKKFFQQWLREWYRASRFKVEPVDIEALAASLQVRIPFRRQESH